MPGRRRYYVYAMLFAFWIIGYFDRVNMSIAAKPIATDMHLSPIAMGYLFSSYTWTYALLLIPSGVLLDRWGTRRLAALGVGVWSAFQILTGLSFNFASMLISRLGLGAGESPGNPFCSRMVREWAPAQERGFATAIFVVASYAGTALGAPLIALLVEDQGWRSSFIVTGALGLGWIVVWLMFFDRPEKTRWLSDAERGYIVANRDASPDSLVDREGWAGVLTLLRYRSMWGLMITQGCLVYMFALFLAWLPTYLNSRGISVLHSGFYTAIPYGVTVLPCLYICHLSDRALSREALLAGDRRYWTIVTALVSLSVLGIQFVNATWAIMTLITICVTFSAISISMHAAVFSDLLRTPGNNGKAYALMIVGGQVGALLSPIVTGYVVSYTGSYNLAFDSAGVLALIGIGVILTMIRHPVGEDTTMARGGELEGRAAAQRA